MSAALLVLLPILLSGYIFATKCKYTYYKVMRLEGYHLYFRAAHYGSFFVLVAAVFYVALYAITPDCILALASKMKLTFNHVFNSTDTSIFNILLVALISIAGSYAAAWYFNKRLDDEFSFKHAIENDDLELLLYRALKEETPIAISMENKKEYVGVIIRVLDPSDDRKFVRILPLLSGFRSKETGKVDYSTPYETVIEDMLEGEENPLLVLEDFEIVLPAADIKSAHLFDYDTYKAFQKKHKEAKNEIGFL